MPADEAAGSIDIRFSVPFTQRLRVTEDVAGTDFGRLLEVLEVGDSEAGDSDGGASSGQLPRTAKVLVWADRQVRRASERVDQIAANLRHSETISLVAEPTEIEGGEPVKNSSEVIEELLAEINRCNLDRRSYIIAIGGGAMLDAAGYAAAIAHRGIRLVRLPTTTLAQADSGVGVKNAINYFGKKNWVGTFAVPWAVINDSRLLETLPDREFRSGFSEAVKVSLLKDRSQFEWLCQHAESIRQRKMEIARVAIDRSCHLHLRHITEGGDPFEMLEARPLDFGHWSAHKLEPMTDYRLRHGEAVGIGVAIDCLYSALMFGFPESQAIRVCECLSSLGIRLWDAEIEPVERLMQGLEEFRQHLGGRLTLTMLRGVGDPINVHQIDPAAMKQAIRRLRQIVGDLRGQTISSEALASD